MLDTAYADKVYDFVMGDLDENGWSLAAVPMQECITNMTEFPSHIVEHIFRLHGTPHMDNKVRRDCCFASFMCNCSCLNALLLFALCVRFCRTTTHCHQSWWHGRERCACYECPDPKR